MAEPANPGQPTDTTGAAGMAEPDDLGQPADTTGVGGVAEPADETGAAGIGEPADTTGAAGVGQPTYLGQPADTTGAAEPSGVAPTTCSRRRPGAGGVDGRDPPREDRRVRRADLRPAGTVLSGIVASLVLTLALR